MSATNTERPLTRVERRQQATRDRLVEAVRTLTAKKGVEALTIRDIAEAADIGMGSFYNHFESKDALLAQAVKENIFQAGELIDSIIATSENPAELMATAFMTFDRILQQDKILGWFIVRVTDYDPSLTQSLFERFVRDVKVGVESGGFDVPDADLAVHMVSASLMEFYRRRLQGRIPDESVPDGVLLTLRMLGADEDAARRAVRNAFESVYAGNQEN